MLFKLNSERKVGGSIPTLYCKISKREYNEGSSDTTLWISDAKPQKEEKKKKKKK